MGRVCWYEAARTAIVEYCAAVGRAEADGKFVGYVASQTQRRKARMSSGQFGRDFSSGTWDSAWSCASCMDCMGAGCVREQAVEAVMADRQAMEGAAKIAGRMVCMEVCAQRASARDRSSGQELSNAHKEENAQRVD